MGEEEKEKEFSKTEYNPCLQKKKTPASKPGHHQI